jgi:amino acid permease
MQRSRLLPTLFTLIGTTIGVGILALPYAFTRSGIVVGIGQVIVAYLLTLVLNLLYVEILLHIKGRHQLAGYAGKFFGSKGKVIATISLLIGAYGACLAYILQGGIFLHTLLPTLPAFYFSLLFFFVIALLLLLDLTLFSYVESIMVGLLLVLIVLIGGVGIRYVDPSNYLLQGNSLGDFFLPYGILLFAFSGYSVIPELGELTNYHRQTLIKAVVLGTTLVAVVYTLFPLLIVGISGGLTSEDAITGLQPFMGSMVTKIAAAVALLPVATSFISLGRVTRDLYEADLKLPKPLSWFLAIYPPLLIFLWNKVGFVKVLEISGGITVGLAGLLICAIYLKIGRHGKTRYTVVSLPAAIIYLVMCVFSFGILYELFRAAV